MCIYLSSRGTERAVRRDCDAVEEGSVAEMIGLQSAVGEVPHLMGREREREREEKGECGKSMHIAHSHAEKCQAQNFTVLHATIYARIESISISVARGSVT